MSNYRRSNSGNCYFFTVVTSQRRPIFADKTLHSLLRNAIKNTQNDYPFTIDAWVLMPDHLHCIWTLPDDDTNFAKRWSLIKSRFSRSLPETFIDSPVSQSNRKYRRRGVWQRRYWEHQIRDEDDFRNHMDYIHFNPVKHGLVQRVCDWPYSTFHRYVESGVYPENWGGDVEISDGQFGE